MGRILVGISSWAEPELVRSGFFPDEVKTAEARLGYYASRFPVAEIDSSYHFFPTQRNLALWIENTPDGFTFDVKCSVSLPSIPLHLPLFPAPCVSSTEDRYKPKQMFTCIIYLMQQLMGSGQYLSGLLSCFKLQESWGQCSFSSPRGFILSLKTSITLAIVGRDSQGIRWRWSSG